MPLIVVTVLVGTRPPDLEPFPLTVEAGPADLVVPSAVLESRADLDIDDIDEERNQALKRMAGTEAYYDKCVLIEEVLSDVG